MPTLQLKPEYLQKLKTLLAEHAPNAEIWAYGSRVDSHSHEASDLDLVVRDPEDLSRPFAELPVLKEALTESDLPILVDILDWARIPARFREKILKNHVIVQGGR